MRSPFLAQIVGTGPERVSRPERREPDAGGMLFPAERRRRLLASTESFLEPGERPLEVALASAPPAAGANGQALEDLVAGHRSGGVSGPAMPVVLTDRRVLVCWEGTAGITSVAESHFVPGARLELGWAMPGVGSAPLRIGSTTLRVGPGFKRYARALLATAREANLLRG